MTTGEEFQGRGTHNPLIKDSEICYPIARGSRRARNSRFRISNFMESLKLYTQTLHVALYHTKIKKKKKLTIRNNKSIFPIQFNHFSLDSNSSLFQFIFLLLNKMDSLVSQIHEIRPFSILITSHCPENARLPIHSFTKLSRSSCNQRHVHAPRLRVNRVNCEGRASPRA